MSLNVIRQPPKQKTAATLSQAAPTQNTWYTVLNTVLNARLLGIGCKVATTAETLEVRITIDGIQYTASVAATAGTLYMLSMQTIDTGVQLNLLTTNDQAYRAFLIEGRSIKVEIRKTTVAGTGTITACVSYQSYN